MSVTDLSGKDIFMSGYSLSLTISNPFGNNNNTPFQLASKSRVSSNVFASSVSFTNVDVSTFFGCGVYCRAKTGNDRGMFGIHFSTKDIRVFASWLADNDVYWVVYPGFSIQLYEHGSYNALIPGNFSNILVNDTNMPFIWGPNSVNSVVQNIYQNGFQQFDKRYDTGYIGSIKVWYQNKALKVDGIS